MLVDMPSTESSHYERVQAQHVRSFAWKAFARKRTTDLESLGLSFECLRCICQVTSFLSCLRSHAGRCLGLRGGCLGRRHHLHGLSLTSVAVDDQCARLHGLQAINMLDSLEMVQPLMFTFSRHDIALQTDSMQTQPSDSLKM